MDITKSTNSLQLVAAFTDGDDRTITVDDPKVSIGAAEVNSISAYIKDNNILLGDKNGADFTKIKSARIVAGTITYFDLND